jgi:hypothetical protein
MITYPFHPLVGQSVHVVGDKEHGGMTELAAHVRRSHPGSDLMRRAPPMPRPKEPVG